MTIDMHFHSNLSDWYSTREEIILEAKRQWLKFIALTDHDKVSYGFREMCLESWILSCQSVEISAINNHHNKSLHLTFYANNISRDISNVLYGVIESKMELIKKQVLYFNSIWFDIDLDQFYLFFILKWRKKESLNKFDICFYLYQSDFNVNKATDINSGEKINMEWFYQKFLKKWWEKYDEYSVKVADYEIDLSVCSDFKNRCDWILSIAHPNVTFKKWWISEFEQVLPYYVENWVNAIEINSRATTKRIESILNAKQKYWLFVTFGSDNHKMWFTDSKHWDFWDINPYFEANPWYAEHLFDEYKNKLWV